MHQPSFSLAPADLQKQLVNALRLGTWIHREQLARMLGVSVRQIREAASHSCGEVLSSNDGLKLTCCATQSELDTAIARMRSQVSEMTRRIVETTAAYDRREQQIAS